jgi:hypothetical protein
LDKDRDNPWSKAFQAAPLAPALLLIGIILGGGAGIWLLVAWLGFDETPAILAGPIVAGMAIAGGFAGVLVAVCVGWLARLIQRVGRGKKKR